MGSPKGTNTSNDHTHYVVHLECVSIFSTPHPWPKPQGPSPVPGEVDPGIFLEGILYELAGTDGISLKQPKSSEKI